jgi:hypothetical protein
MKTWLRLPLAVRVVIIAGVWFSYALLVLDLGSLDSSSQAAKLIWTACLVGAVVTVGVELGVRPKFGSLEQLAAYNRALQTGELPPGIDPDVWRRWLRRSGWMQVALWWTWWFVIFGWLLSVGSQSAYHWLPASAFSLLAIWGFVAWCRRNFRIRRLAAEVKRRRNRLDRDTVTPGEPQAAVTRKEEQWGTWFRLPLAWRVFGSVVSGFCFAFLALLVAGLDSVVYNHSRIAHLGWAALWAALMGLANVVAAVGDPRWRGSFGSVEQLIAYDQALRTGELPERIEPDMWRGWLRSSRRFLGIVRASWACFFVAVGVSSVLTHQSGYRWVTAWLFELFAMWLLVSWWGGGVRLKRLAAEVERRAMRQSWG